MKFHIIGAATILLSSLLTAEAQVTGSGTTNFIPKWKGSMSLGNSALFQGSGQNAGQIGIGTMSPVARLTVIGLNGTIDTNGGNAPKALQVTGGFGGTNFSGFGVQGAGGAIQIVSGTGAPLPGSFALGGTGAAILLTGGSGANCTAASVRCGTYVGGNGGSITLQPGVGGRGLSSAGHAGNVFLAPTGGKVGIGTSSPNAELHVIGNFIATGSKSALVETASYGKRQLYATESPENWFEDFGKGQLSSGRAIVKIDPVFMETVNTEYEYHVFLTPKGDCKGLYVAKQSVTSFEVRELQNGKSTIAFDYRVVAKRKGYEGARLAEVRAEENIQVVQMSLPEK